MVLDTETVFLLHLKGALKAHIHIGLYESNTLQEQDAAILFLSVIPRGEIFAYCHPPGQPVAATGCGHVFQVLSAVTHWVAGTTSCLQATSGQCIITAELLTRALCTRCIKTYIKQENGKIMCSNWL